MPAHCKDRPQAPKKLEGEALAQQRRQLHAQLSQVDRDNQRIEKDRAQKVADLAADSSAFMHRMHRQEMDGQAIRGSTKDAVEAYRKQVGEDNLPRAAAQSRKPAWLTGQPRRKPL
jgi:hypothetical protein